MVVLVRTRPLSRREKLAWLYRDFSTALLIQKEYQAAIDLIPKSTFFAEQVKNQIAITENYELLGIIMREEGDYQASIPHLLDAMMLFLDQGRLISVVHCIEQIAMSSIGLGRSEVAAHLMRAAAQLHTKLLPEFETSVIDDFDEYIDIVRNKLGEPSFHELFEDGRAMTVYEIRDLCSLG